MFPGRIHRRGGQPTRTRVALAVGAIGLVTAMAAVTGVAAAGEEDPVAVPSGSPEPTASASAPVESGDPRDLIELPDGFQPEGIAIGEEPVAFFGSLADGSIFRADLRSGAGEVISEGPGTPSVGLALDGRGRLFVAGGRAGDARVVDTGTGEVLASVDLASAEEGFVNDVVVTEDAAFFTDSTNPVLYRLPLEGSDALPGQDDVEEIPLTGAIEYGEGINANGIVATPDGAALLIVQTSTGLLFRVDPATGETEAVPVVAAEEGDELLPNGDGMLVLGQTLFVVQNRLNAVAVLELNAAGTQADLVDRLTDPRFDVPTTVAAFDDRLFLPNARFGTTPEATTEYTAVGIAQP